MLDELVRDLTCRTKPMAKSEVRRRIKEYAEKYSNREETFYSTIVNSDTWKEWIDYQEKEEKEMKFDVWESTECNMLSNRHFKEFIKWVKNKKIIKRK